MLEQRTRTAYADRNRTYSLRDSEIYTLSEVGKFRVVAKIDLAEFAYNRDRSRMENDVENLVRQGLAKVTTIPDIDYNPSQVVTLTKEGHKLLSRGKVLPSSQAIYHGLKKPKEAAHDADLYRLYHKVSDEIESKGGRVLRVQLDYEMKDELYSRLARASQDKTRNTHTLRQEVAAGYHLKVVSGKIPIPDLRVEYVNENDNQIQRRDLELATDHYRPRGLSQKARAGFQMPERTLKRPHRFLTAEEVRRLVAASKEPTRTIILLATMTGLRIGEILALRWGRIDLLRGTLLVAETCYKGHFGTPKTRASKREVPLAPVVVRELKEHYSRSVDHSPSALVFATNQGTPLAAANLRRESLSTACKRVGLQRIDWHTLRHTHGTLLHSQGTPLKVAQAQLGHSHMATTLEVYTHASASAQRDAVNLLEDQLFPNVPKFERSGNTTQDESQLVQ
jgi:integrase